MIRHICVTQEDGVGAVRADPNACPVSRAMTREFGCPVAVCGPVAFVDGPPRKLVGLPPWVSQAVSRFDRTGRMPYPLEFDIDEGQKVSLEDAFCNIGKPDAE